MVDATRVGFCAGGRGGPNPRPFADGMGSLDGRSGAMGVVQHRERKDVGIKRGTRAARVGVVQRSSQFRTPLRTLAECLQAERSRWALWAPVHLGAGIILYLSWSREPSLWSSLGAVAVAVIAYASIAGRGIFRPVICGGLVMIAGGHLAAHLHAQWAAAAILNEAAIAALDTAGSNGGGTDNAADRVRPDALTRQIMVRVSGWLERFEPRGTDGARLIIRVQRLATRKGTPVPPALTPARVRVSVRAKLLAQSKRDPPVRDDEQNGPTPQSQAASTGTTSPRPAGAIVPGAPISVSAILSPPGGPVLPGGFDFARWAYFRSIGAVGFAVASPQRSGVLEPKPPQAALTDGPRSSTVPTRSAAPEPPWSVRIAGAINAVRQAVAARIQASLPQPQAGVAIALITGERGAIPEDLLDAIRDAGLAHLLAISGLHMAVMGGSIYLGVRFFLACVPGLALRLPIRLVAALFGIAGAASYLLISGASAATQRAFIMLVLVMLALMLGRPLLTLRNVALAALVILLASPHLVIEPGFQMSFAAVAALVSLQEHWRRQRDGPPAAELAQQGKPPAPLWTAPPEAQEIDVRRLPTLTLVEILFPPDLAGGGAAAPIWERAWYDPLRLLASAIWLLSAAFRLVAGVAVTTVVASLAVAPFAAYHFNTFPSYGVVANLVVVPMVTIIGMPVALASLIAMPFAMEGPPLAVLGMVITVMLDVAREVAAWPGAEVPVARVPGVAMACAALGLAWLLIWQGRWRGLGVAGLGLGLAMAPFGARPDIYVAGDGKAFAVRLDDGRLSGSRRYRRSFAARNWVRADGDGRDMALAFNNGGIVCERNDCVATVAGLTFARPRSPAALRQDCAQADIVVTPLVLQAPCRAASVTVGGAMLARTGAVAITIRTPDDASSEGRLPGGLAQGLPGTLSGWFAGLRSALSGVGVGSGHATMTVKGRHTIQVTPTRPANLRRPWVPRN